MKRISIEDARRHVLEHMVTLEAEEVDRHGRRRLGPPA
jgi:hypothetical protein